MPSRAPRKVVGTNVGRMIFHSTTKKGIERKLGKINQNDFKKALDRRGLSGVSNEDIAEVMSGKHKAGWSQGKMRRVVEALQDVDVARKARSASQMVLQASRDAQSDRHERMKGLARQRRSEANLEGSQGEKRMGVLDQMRSDIGRANKVAGTRIVSREEGEDGTGQKNSIDRDRLELQPKIKPPKNDRDEENPYAGFQA